MHVSSYFLLAGSLGPGLPGLLGAARAAGARTSLDTNWDPSGGWLDERLSAVLGQADLLLPNEAEAMALGGSADLAGAVRALTASGLGLVVKRGEQGVLCAAGGRQWQVSVPPVVPVDSTGAGDCCNAGLIAGLLDGLAMPEAAALGCAAGALSTQAAGGTAGGRTGPRAAACAQRASVSPVQAGATLAKGFRWAAIAIPGRPCQDAGPSVMSRTMRRSRGGQRDFSRQGGV